MSAIHMNSPNRPKAVTNLAILGFIISIVTIVWLLSSPTYMERIISRLGEEYLYFKLGMSSIIILAFIGAYMLRRWSIYLFVGCIVIYAIYPAIFTVDRFYFSNFVIPVLGLLVMYKYQGSLR